MAAGRWAIILRILKPLAAGVALAYLATAFVDKPAPVHFQPENPYAAKQAEIVEPQAGMVMEKNIMKLGSPLSVQSSEAVEEGDAVETPEIRVGQDSATANATQSVKGEVKEIPAP